MNRSMSYLAFTLLGAGLALFLAAASDKLVLKQPWMDTAMLAMEHKRIAQAGHVFVLVPDDCVDEALNLKIKCVDRAIILPILP